MKVKLTDNRVLAKTAQFSSAIFGILAAVLIFVDLPDGHRIDAGKAVLTLIVGAYFLVWARANRLNQVSVSVDGSVVDILVGDIFRQPGLKAIAFNEYFDTVVDDVLIARNSVNGTFIAETLAGDVAALDEHIRKYKFQEDEIAGKDVSRKAGKKVRYRVGTICVYDDYLLTAFAKFDKENCAALTMPEYLEFLITFWDKVNKIYAQKSVSTTIFGSGITRIKGHKNISDEDLLKIMLWTFRISEMRFKFPAKLTIVIHPDKIDRINLLDVQSARTGL